MAALVAKPNDASEDVVLADDRENLAYASGWCDEHLVRKLGSRSKAFGPLQTSEAEPRTDAS